MSLRVLVFPLLLLSLLVAGCSGSSEDDDSSATGDDDITQGDDDTGSGDDDSGTTDGDGDGFSPPDDCDDEDGSIFPGATEQCNDKDDNCDGSTDEGTPTGARTWFADSDSDTYGDPASTQTACDAPSGYVSNDDDCDDTDAQTNPGVSEICGDGTDNNCNESADSCGLAGEVSTLDNDVRLIGEAQGDQAGYAIAGIGDFNGDGKPDLAIGAQNESSELDHAGAIYVLFSPLSATESLAGADVKLTGDAAQDGAGAAIAGAGDVNGDGTDDLIVGVPFNDAAGKGAGAAYLVYGPLTGEHVLGEVGVKFTGEAAANYAGYSVAGAGDLNDDGYDDLIVGAYQDATTDVGAGAAYVIYGQKTKYTGTVSLASAGAKLLGEHKNDFAGYSVAGAGDVNGDGRDDILVGAYGVDAGGHVDAGMTYLLLGPVNGSVSLADATAKIAGENPGDGAGRSLAGVGDVNGDGNDDVLIGAVAYDLGGTDSGAAFLLLGPLSGEVSVTDADSKLYGASEDDQAGRVVAGGGDVNGDGYADYLVCALDLNRREPTARTYLMFGTAAPAAELSLVNADAVFYSTDTSETIGHTAAGAGDVNGDGLDDIALGVPTNESDATYPGGGYIFHGGSGL